MLANKPEDKMIKAFAKLEGVKLYKDTIIIESKIKDALRCRPHGLTKKQVAKNLTNCANSVYNPIKDELAFEAMAKYHVDIYHKMCCVNIDDQSGLPFVSFLSNGIQYAIIECILKSKGIDYA